MEQSSSEAADAVKPKKKRLRGFAGSIGSLLLVLNGSDYFKQKYGQDAFRLLLIARDDKHAAFVSVNKGLVEVEEVQNDPHELKHLKVDGRVSCRYDDFFLLSSGKLNVVNALLKGRLRIQNIRLVKHFTQYFKIVSYILKHSSESSKNVPQS